MPKTIRISVQNEAGREEFSATIRSKRFDALQPPGYGLRQIAEELREFLPDQDQTD